MRAPWLGVNLSKHSFGHRLWLGKCLYFTRTVQNYDFPKKYFAMAKNLPKHRKVDGRSVWWAPMEGADRPASVCLSSRNAPFSRTEPVRENHEIWSNFASKFLAKSVEDFLQKLVTMIKSAAFAFPPHKPSLQPMHGNSVFPLAFHLTSKK